MEWLNYHHLLYFWNVAKEGSLRKASEKLHVSQSSISAQIGSLEEALGEKLFRPSGRTKVLTDMGRVVMSYADDISSLGREMMNTVKHRAGARPVRFHIGVADSVPKLIAYEIIRPVFHLQPSVEMVCREGKVSALCSLKIGNAARPGARIRRTCITHIKKRHRPEWRRVRSSCFLLLRPARAFGADRARWLTFLMPHGGHNETPNGPSFGRHSIAFHTLRIGDAWKHGVPL